MDQLIEFLGHHPVLATALSVVLVLLVVNEIVGALKGGQRLSAPEAVRLINDRDPVIIDLRPAADYKRGHLLNAVNIPFARLDERTRELGKSRERPVLLYCAMGGMAAQASEKLRKAGFAEVYPLRGGIHGWMSANLPVTTR